MIFLVLSKLMEVILRDSVNQQENYQLADGVISNIVNLPIAIRTADCLPVFILDSRRRCFGLIHAGWKGSKNGILEKTLRLLDLNFCSNPSELKIVFGPSIRDCCYQVGEKFLEYFPEEIIVRDSLYLNLVNVNKRQLMEGGVLEQNIQDCNVCTCCNESFFSHRRDGEKFRRMISLMMLEETF